jgi:hypothetical protein
LAPLFIQAPHPSRKARISKIPVVSQHSAKIHPIFSKLPPRSHIFSATISQMSLSSLHPDLLAVPPSAGKDLSASD